MSAGEAGCDILCGFAEYGCRQAGERVPRNILCPAKGQYGVQIPKGAWHTIEVFEESTIFESKDGKYMP